MNALNLSKDDRIRIKGCPHCGGPAIVSTAGGYDERNGYNFTAEVRCQNCGANVLVGSLRNKNGWCTEDRESAENRASVLWNRRHDETPSEFERLIGKENSHV